MARKLILIMAGLACLCLVGKAQKRPLDMEAYNRWQRVDNQNISDDGRWVSYRVVPMNGEGAKKDTPRVYLYDTRKRQTMTIEGTDQVSFLANAKWIAYEVKDTARDGRDTTWLLRLSNRKKICWDREYGFNPVDRTDLLAWQYNLPAKDSAGQKSPCRRLVVWNVETGDSTVIDSVGFYVFYNDYRSIIYLKKSANHTALYAGPLKGKQKAVFEQPDIRIESFSWEPRKLGGTFSIASDSLIYGFSLKGEPCRLLFDKSRIKVPEGKRIGRIDLSNDWTFVTYELLPARESRPSKKEKPDESFILQLWTWDEEIVPSRQEKDGLRPNRNYPKYIYYLREDKSVFFAGEETENIYWPENACGNYILTTTKVPYRKTIDYHENLHFDIHLVNRYTGERRLLLEDQTETPVWGPLGKYALLYDSRVKIWYKLDGLTGEMTDISTAIGYPVFNEDHDKPCPARPYGIAGWLADGEKVLLNDRFDWWMIDLTGETKPVCYTGGEGRKNQTAIRLLRSNFDPKVLDIRKAIWVETFNVANKRESIGLLQPGGRLRPLMEGDYNYRIDKLSEDQKHCIFTRQNFTEFRDLWWSSTDFSAPVRITNVNPQQSEYLWGKARLVEWTNYEGKQNQGILYLPENYNPQEKYPVLVQFYETHTNEINVYPAPALSMAMADVATYVSNGYIVFMPDVHFTVGNPGQSSYDAVVSGVNMLIDKGIADKDRIGLQGHSWSGYQTSYLVTKTDLFRCANIGAPITDMVSGYVGIRNGSGLVRFFMYEDTQSRMGKSLWDYKDGYLRNSALLEADKITTPLLIFHCDEDEAVAYEQGRALYLAMRRLRKPAWLLNYKGQGHFLYNSAAQLDWTIRMQQFFDHYLKDAPVPRWMKEGININERGIDQKYDYVK